MTELSSNSDMIYTTRITLYTNFTHICTYFYRHNTSPNSIQLTTVAQYLHFSLDSIVACKCFRATNRSRDTKQHVIYTFVLSVYIVIHSTAQFWHKCSNIEYDILSHFKETTNMFIYIYWCFEKRCPLKKKTYWPVDIRT